MKYGKAQTGDLFEGFYKNEEWPQYRTVVHLPIPVYEWLLEFKALGLLEQPIKGKSVYGHGVVFCRSLDAYRAVTNDRLPVWDKQTYAYVLQNFQAGYVTKGMRLWCSPADDRFIQKALKVRTSRAFKGDPYQRFGMPTLVAGILIWAYIQQRTKEGRIGQFD
jgi:hypothetical protein